MTTMQQLNRFRELPRELQLRIWELYECSQPHRRHYFRSMIVWPGRLYAGVDQYTNRRIVNIATANDPNQTRVPDTAVAPWTKIQLPADDKRDDHWVSRHDFSAAAPFCQIQGPNSMTTPAYSWVNFKNDTFCFAHNSGGIIHNVGGRDFLQYLQGVPGLFSLTSGPQSQGMSHWFFRVERLALIKFAPDRKLGHFDRQVLGMHPSLRTVTIVAFLGPFRCSHFDLATQRQPDAATAVEQISLKKFLAIRWRVARSCDCDEPRKRLDELEQLRQELVSLFQNRAIVAPRVDVGIEVEVYWTQRPDIASLVVDPQS